MVFIDVPLEETIDPVSQTSGKRPRRRVRLSRSKKMITGMVLLAIFVLLAIIGPLIAPYDPTALGPLQAAAAGFFSAVAASGQPALARADADRR